MKNASREGYREKGFQKLKKKAGAMLTEEKKRSTQERNRTKLEDKEEERKEILRVVLCGL